VVLRLLLALAMGGASGACALAAVGWSLYGQSPAVMSAVQIFAVYGFVAGLACGALHLHFQGRPAAAPAALSSQALAGLVRAALASTAAQRQARPGSAADRQPAAPPAVAPATTAPAPLPPAAAPATAPAPAHAAAAADAAAEATAA
jgi:hypothetical protein